MKYVSCVTLWGRGGEEENEEGRGGGGRRRRIEDRGNC